MPPQNKILFSVSMETFFITPIEMKKQSQWKLKIISSSAQQQIDWRDVNYCSENKMKIPNISYAEVQSDLQAPLEQKTGISKVQIHKG